MTPVALALIKDQRESAYLMICRASWRPFIDRACRAIAAVVALLLCSMGLGRLLATISRWLTCSARQRKEGHSQTWMLGWGSRSRFWHGQDTVARVVLSAVICAGLRELSNDTSVRSRGRTRRKGLSCNQAHSRPACWRTTSMGTMTDCVARLATAPPTPLLTVAVWAAVSCARSQNRRHVAFTISSVVRYTWGAKTLAAQGLHSQKPDSAGPRQAYEGAVWVHRRNLHEVVRKYLDSAWTP